MKRISDKEVADYIAQFPWVSFTNEHGEEFVISSNGITVYMSGDEVDMMVEKKDKIGGKYIPLFNPHFGIWSENELTMLGEALQELMKEVPHGRG